MAPSDAPAYPAFGEFVKTQRALAQLSLRQASAIARISNPYLSQIEHGWVLPSVAVMSKLAEAFSVSAETFLMQAAVAASGTEPVGQPSTEEAIQRDPRLSVEEKKALLLIVESFTGSARPSAETSGAPAKRTARAKPKAAKPKAAKTSGAAAPTSKSSTSSARSRRPRAAMSATTSSTTQPEGVVG